MIVVGIKEIEFYIIIRILTLSCDKHHFDFSVKTEKLVVW